MDSFDNIVKFGFILALVLIVVAYFAGVVTESNTFFAGVNKLGLTFTGRNAQGNFAAYPARP